MKKISGLHIVFLIILTLITNCAMAAAPPVLDSIIGLYVAYYNRAPDKEGVEYWQGQAAANGDAAALFAISKAFAANPQYAIDYPASMSRSEFITQIYSNILRRAPETEGLNYWVTQLTNGLPESEFIVTYVNAVLSYDGTDAGGISSQSLFVNKVSVSKYFYQTLGTHSNGATGSAAYLKGIEVLTNVTEDSATVDSAKTIVNDYLTSAATQSATPLSTTTPLISNSSISAAGFSKRITGDIFGVTIIGTSSTADSKMIHAANIMAEYLDNNEDGAADNELIITQMKKRSSVLYMYNDSTDSGYDIGLLGDTVEAQDLGAFETFTNGEIVNGEAKRDASLEEVLHLITSKGYANVYTGLNITQGTTVANAMDKARGGTFTTIPTVYPASAWFTYYDATCDYGCMVTEYTYWGVTSYLGAHEYAGRDNAAFSVEWKPNTKILLQQMDPDMYAIMQDATYQWPTVLPDGVYIPKTFEVESF